MKKVINTLPMLKMAVLPEAADAYTHCTSLLRLRARCIIAEVKLDGIECDLTYRDGFLELATISDGGVVEGYDITDLVLTVDSIPKRITHTQYLVVHGTLVLPIEVLLGYRQAFANMSPSEAVNAVIWDTSHVCRDKLEFVMHDHSLVNDCGPVPDTHVLTRQFMHAGGARVHCLDGFSEADFRGMMGRTASIKLTNRFDTRGVVIKIRAKSTLDRGHEYIAGTFLIPETTVTTEATALEFSWQSTKSGKLSPNLLVEENGYRLNVNLHNLKNAQRCLIGVGDVLLLDRRGTTGPIVRGMKEIGEEFNPFKLVPETCPSCGSAIERKGQIEDPYCVNAACPGVNMALIRFILGRTMLNVPNLTDALINDIWGVVRDSKHPLQIALFKAPTQNISLNLHATLQRHLVMPMYKALAMLNIPQMSVVALKNLVAGHSKITNLFLSVHTMRNDRERNILTEWWSHTEHRHLVYKMDRFFVYGTPSPDLYDRNVCITGRFPSSRSQLIRKLNKLNYGVHGTLARHTDVVLAGEMPGSVVELAKDRKIPVVYSIDELKKFKPCN